MASDNAEYFELLQSYLVKHTTGKTYAILDAYQYLNKHTNMPEQLSPSTTDSSGLRSGDWQEVADQMHTWHPDLQTLAERKLTEHGILPEQTTTIVTNDTILDDNEKNKAIDAHNDFANIIPGLIVTGKRLDLGKDVRGSDRNSKEFIDEYAEHLYNIVRDAAVLPIPEDWVHVYGKNLSKIGGIFGDLARSYKLALRNGVYTSFTSRRLTGYDPVTKQMPKSNDIRRIPTPILGDEFVKLKNAPENERLQAVAEMLDHARYRHDVDADPEQLKAQEQEQEFILHILETLPNDFRRDLLSADAASHFLHRRINRPDLAERSLDLISIPKLSEDLAEFLTKLSISTPEAIVERVSKTSTQELERVASATGRFEGRIDEVMEQARLLEPEASVVINMQTDKLINFLFETFRMLPAYEAGTSSIQHLHRWDRIYDEVQLGLHGENDLLRERPIYGALAVTVAEKTVGPDSSVYGRCVVEIKPSVVRERTTYTYGDSLNARRMSSLENEAKPVNFETALSLKTMFDQMHPNPSLKDDLREPYIEAQILGGVGLEDVASITLPYEDVVSFRGNNARYQVLRAIKEDYPSLVCRLVIQSETYTQLSEEARATFTEAGIDLVVAPE